MKTYHVLLILLLFAHCIQTGKEAKVAITKEYVINPNWDEDDNSFEVERLKLKDSSNIINMLEVSQSELLSVLEKDPKFSSYTTNVAYNGESYSDRKVYFNKYNGFEWWRWSPSSGRLDLERGFKTIGELENNNWYSLGGLSRFGTVYYVYVDSTGNIHRFSIVAPNW